MRIFVFVGRTAENKKELVEKSGPIWFCLPTAGGKKANDSEPETGFD